MPAARTAPVARTTTTRSWWREHFFDHPKLTAKDPSALAGGKPKVWCKMCRPSDVALIQLEDEREIAAKTRVNVRDKDKIIEECEFKFSYAGSPLPTN